MKLNAERGHVGVVVMQSDDTSMSSRPGHLRHCCPSLVAPSIEENNGVKYALRHGDSIQIFF